jgi:hypothetical protein
MKRITLLAAVAFAMLVPTLAHSQGLHFVYRPELRQWITMPDVKPSTAAVMQSAADIIARHEAMAHAYRGGHNAQSAVHCDRLVQQAREDLRKQS